jgi:hypothetical protein
MRIPDMGVRTVTRSAACRSLAAWPNDDDGGDERLAPAVARQIAVARSAVTSHMEKGLQRPPIRGPAAGRIDACATKAPSGFFHVSACVQPALEAAEIAHVAVTHILQCLADER